MIALEIIDYSSKYIEDIKDLLVELQEYIAEIDREEYNILTDEYREKYFEKTLNEVGKYEGKIFLAREDEKIIKQSLNIDELFSNVLNFASQKDGESSAAET